MGFANRTREDEAGFGDEPLREREARHGSARPALLPVQRMQTL
ncbi:hypothetical protein SAMN02745194_03004 [Roseomonas rosea]|uniref:Uncharacterized protein n=1 Tax=Muricoccus roseus TaxID=198092 RepID=A0A1M6KWH0_9PROT|nr:hypothetical protein SAMN02745194_03004 [Roseomonas rosea]